MKWCCDFFEQMYISKGQRGFAIILIEDQEPYFALQFRVTLEGKEIDIKSNGPVSLEGKTAILHCPSCGKNVPKYYKRQIEALRNIKFENVRDGL